MKTIEIQNRIGRVKLNDSVNPWSTDDLIGDIEKLYGQKAVAENMSIGGFMASADDALETLEIEIHSPGGSVLDGYRAYSALQEMKSRGVRVVAVINTLAASMASVIVMAADEVHMVSGGRMMIHEASQTVAGDSAAHARAAKILDEMSDEIAEIYAYKTGGKREEMRALMLAETWMGAKEAKERGFIDKILTAGTKAEFDTTTNSMSILAKLFPGNDQVAKFEAQVLENEQLRNDLTEAEAKISELSAFAQVVAEKDAEITAFQSKLSSLEQAQIEAQAKIVELTEAATLTAEKISLEASRQLASTGHPEPVVVVNEAPANSITRAEFNALDHIERATYIRKGGKVTQ
jgi:ATP-dependent protease ClpP protease subunit